MLPSLSFYDTLHIDAPQLLKTTNFSILKKKKK